MQWYTQIVDMADGAKTIGDITTHETRDAADRKAREELEGWMGESDVILVSKRPSFGRRFFQIKTPDGWVDFIAIVGEVK